jgi:adenylate cyclase
MRLRKAEFERVNAKPRDTWQAYDYYMKGTECAIYYSLTLKSELIAEAQRLLEQCIVMDPSGGRAYARLSGIHVGRYVVWFDDGYLSRKTLEQAYQLALTGVQLEPDFPLVHVNLALVLLYLNRDRRAALINLERALSLNPNYQDSREVLILTSACEFERAIQAAQRMLRIDSLVGAVLIYSGLAHYMAKRYAEAYTQLHECVARSPNSRPSHLFLAATCARMGRLDEARAEIAEVLRIVPGYTIDGTAKRVTFFRDPEANEHYYGALQIAGLPQR